MLSFSEPWYLLLLPLAGVVGWWHWRRKQPALRVSDTRLVTSLPPGRAPFLRRVETAVYSAAAFCLVVALSDPRWPLPTPITTEGIAIALIVDVSGSMYEIDFE